MSPTAPHRPAVRPRWHPLSALLLVGAWVLPAFAQDSENNPLSSILNGAANAAPAIIAPGGLQPAGTGAGEPAFDGAASCDGVGCGESQDFQELPGLEEPAGEGNLRVAEGDCPDIDGDGICDDKDACLDTPPNTKVLQNGCHLDQRAPLILSGVNFESGSAQLTDAARKKLEEVAALIKHQSEAKVVIEGHTDSLGDDSANLRLSYERAETVYQFLLTQGANRDQLTYLGRGETRPIASNQSAGGQALNRRIELQTVAVTQFEPLRKAMLERERQRRLAQEAREQAQRDRIAAEQARQERAVAASESYEEVLEFLESTGAAEVSKPSEEPTESTDNTDEPEYRLDVITPEVE